MAKVQTRRNVSVTAETYARLKAYCEASGISMSGTVEAVLAPVLMKGPKHEDLMSNPIADAIDRLYTARPPDPLIGEVKAMRRFR